MAHERERLQGVGVAVRAEVHKPLVERHVGEPADGSGGLAQGALVEVEHAHLEELLEHRLRALGRLGEVEARVGEERAEGHGEPLE